MHLLIFTFGIIIGSFLNVCIYRLPREESIAFPPSHCTACNHPLKWYDLIPLFSYLTLRGKCRYCGERISPQYPIIELTNGLLYLLTFTYFGLSINFIFYSLIVSILIVISVIDYYHQIIPDECVIFIFATTILYKTALYFTHQDSLSIQQSIFGLLAGGALFFLLAVVSNGGMGGGDIKLIAALGFILGLKNVIITILLSFIIGAVLSLFLLLSGKKKRKDAIPFGPFINIAFMITLIFGEKLLSWYMITFIL